MLSTLFIIIGLAVFETVCSIENAVINAEVLNTLPPRPRKWFLTWGLLLAVVIIRGILPWLIIWATLPNLGPAGAFTASFSGNTQTAEAITSAAPILLIGGGTFLLFLFLHWLFREEKEYGLPTEAYFHRKHQWFYVAATLALFSLVWIAISRDVRLAMAALVGTVIFFVLNRIKERAEWEEEQLTKHQTSALKKLLYLEIIDAAFSIDGVLGAFAFTLSVPLILIGNGLGALAVRQLTVSNLEVIRRYRYLKNGAMYAMVALSIVMLLDGFGAHISPYISPLLTLCIIGYFFAKSRNTFS